MKITHNLTKRANHKGKFSTSDNFTVFVENDAASDLADKWFNSHDLETFNTLRVKCMPFPKSVTVEKAEIVQLLFIFLVYNRLHKPKQREACTMNIQSAILDIKIPEYSARIISDSYIAGFCDAQKAASSIAFEKDKQLAVLIGIVNRMVEIGPFHQNSPIRNRLDAALANFKIDW